MNYISRKKFKSKGFTLIEVMVVVLIIAIISTLGWANFRRFSRRQQLISYIRQVESDLRLTQSLAFAGTNSNPNLCKSLDGWKFCACNGNSYKIYAVCNTNATPLPDYKEVKLPTNVTINLVNTSDCCDCIMFKTLGQGTNIGTGTTASVTITDSFNDNISIDVTPQGEIKVIK